MTFIKYVAVGVLVYGLDMTVFLVVLKTELAGPVVANVISRILGGVLGFLLHQNFTFGSNGCGNSPQQALRYAILLLINVPISAALLAAALIVIDYAAAAKVAADVVAVLITYVVSASLVFVAPRDHEYTRK